MKLIDILKMAIHNLWQRKLRGALNLIGIVIGCIILLLTTAGATGVEKAIHVLFNSSEYARQIEVMPGRRDSSKDAESVVVEGEMSDQRRERIKIKIVEHERRKKWIQNRVFLTPEFVDEFEKEPHVVEVVPETSFSCRTRIDDKYIESFASGISIDNPGMNRRILVGKMLGEDDRNSVLIHEYVAYRLGFRDDRDIEALIGKKLTMEYNVSGRGLSMLYRFLNPDKNTTGKIDLEKQAEFLKTFRKMIGEVDLSALSDEQKSMIKTLVESKTGGDANNVTQSREFTIKGIFFDDPNDKLWTLFRRYILNRDSDIALHSKVTTPIYLINSTERRFYTAMVKVDNVEQLEVIVPKIEEKGLHAISALPILKDIHREIRRFSWLFYGLALSVLLIAGIGISNTLIISVLERTPEFGIMKAVGAKDRHVLVLMICEGAILGVIGALVAFGIARLIGLVGASILEKYVEGRIREDLPANLFYFSWQPVVIVTLISALICVVASLIPAYRAARLDPVRAMRRI